MNNDTPPTSLDDADPDAQGLPPHIQLPDRHHYMRSQFRARALLCAVGLVIVGAFWFANRGTSAIYPWCFALVGVTLLVTLFRLWRVSRLIDAQNSRSQDIRQHD